MVDKWQEEAARRKEWLAGLEEGDEVAIYHSGIYGHHSFDIVTRTTGTCFVVRGTKYRKKDGYEQGSGYGGRNSLVEPTAELKQQVADAQRRRQIEKVLNDYKWNRLELAQLETVYAALPQTTKSE